MGKKKSSHRGIEGFEAFYSQAFGERWKNLKPALLASKKHVAFYNPFSQSKPIEGESSFDFFPELYKREEVWPPPSQNLDGLYNYYLMDLASALAPLALDIKSGDKVLDLCAAPGGKSLLLAKNLGEAGELTANDRSRDRRGRLKKVLEQYLPASLLERVQVTGHDSTKWCLHETEAYDKILLDAPCSSERHVLESPKHLDQWSIKRTKNLAITQWSMLASSLEVLKTGGRMVYSTCALSPLENDEIIKKLLEKRAEKVKLLKPEFPIGEPTKYGWAILPDNTGWGPFYLALIQKI